MARSTGLGDQAQKTAALLGLTGNKDKAKAQEEKSTIAPKNQDTVAPVEASESTPRFDGRRNKKKQEQDAPYVHKSYYITKEQEKALKLRAFEDDELDLSGHVRAALEMYLEKQLDSIRNK